MKNWKTSLFGFLNIACAILPAIYPPAAPVCLALVPLLSGCGHIVAADAKCDGTGGCKKQIINGVIAVLAFLILAGSIHRASALSFYSQRMRTPLQVFVVPSGNPNTDLYATNGAVGSMAMVQTDTNGVLWIKLTTNGYVVVGTGMVVSNEVTVTNIVTVYASVTNVVLTNVTLYGETTFTDGFGSSTANGIQAKFNQVWTGDLSDQTGFNRILLDGGGTHLLSELGEELLNLHDGSIRTGGTVELLGNSITSGGDATFANLTVTNSATVGNDLGVDGDVRYGGNYLTTCDSYPVPTGGISILEGLGVTFSYYSLAGCIGP